MRRCRPDSSVIDDPLAREGAVAVAQAGGGSPEARCDTTPPHPPVATAYKHRGRVGRDGGTGRGRAGLEPPQEAGAVSLSPAGHRGVLPGLGQPGCGTGTQQPPRAGGAASAGAAPAQRQPSSYFAAPGKEFSLSVAGVIQRARSF